MKPKAVLFYGFIADPALLRLDISADEFLDDPVGWIVARHREQGEDYVDSERRLFGHCKFQRESRQDLLYVYTQKREANDYGVTVFLRALTDLEVYQDDLERVRSKVPFRSYPYIGWHLIATAKT